MAVDSLAKRASLLGYAECFDGIPPLPDGTLSVVDRTVLLDLYYWDLPTIAVYSDARAAWLGYASPADGFLPSPDGSFTDLDRAQITGMQRLLNVGAISFSITGHQITSASGALIVPTTGGVALLGDFATGEAGSFTILSDSSFLVPGARAPMYPGNVSARITHGSAWYNGRHYNDLWWNDTWFNLIVTVVASPAGVEATLETSDLTVTTESSYPILGASSNGIVGQLSITADGATSLGLEGVEISSAYGDLIPLGAASYVISGNAATGGVGSLTVHEAVVPITGQEITSGIGAVVVAAQSIASILGNFTNVIYGDIGQETGFSATTRPSRVEIVEADERTESIEQNRVLLIESRDRRVIVE